MTVFKKFIVCGYTSKTLKQRSPNFTALDYSNCNKSNWSNGSKKVLDFLVSQ